MLRIINLTLLLSFISLAVADDSELGKMLEQRLKLYQEISSLKSQWLLEELAYKERIALRINELTALNKANSKIKQETEDLNKTLDKQAIELKNILDNCEDLHKKLDHVEEELLKVIKQLPKPLLDLIPAHKDLAKQEQIRTAVQLSTRSRKLKELAQDLQKIQKQSHILKEKLSVDGKEQEFRVLYLGSALGYYLSHDSLSAGLIIWQDGKWTTQSHNELASEINKAIAIQQGKTKPELLKLLIPAISEEGS